MTREELKVIPVAAANSAVPRYLKFPPSPLLPFGTLPRLTGFVLPAQRLSKVLPLALLKAELIFR